LLWAVAYHKGEAKERDKLLHLMFNFIKWPDTNHRYHIPTIVTIETLLNVFVMEDDSVWIVVTTTVAVRVTVAVVVTVAATIAARGAVEKWLLQVQDVMLISIRDVVEKAQDVSIILSITYLCISLYVHAHRDRVLELEIPLATFPYNFSIC